MFDLPEQEQRHSTIVLYDYDGDGEQVWVSVRFVDALAVAWTPDLSCRGIRTVAYSKIGEVESSNWLIDLSNAVEGNRMLFPKLAKHFIIYFDHFGCIEVVASRFFVTENVDAPTRC